MREPSSITYDGIAAGSVGGSKMFAMRGRGILFTTILPWEGCGVPEYLVRQKNSWVDSGSGNLPSE
jgi:hypothetical protein